MMRKVIAVSIVFSVLVISFAQEQNTILYGYISNIESSQYLEMANNVKDSSQISDIRRSILQDQNLSKEEKVRLITKVGEIQIAKIEHEGTVERRWIYAEAAVSATIRGLNIYFNKNPAAAGAVDSFAQSILEGKCRQAVIDVYEKGDWSGIEKMATDAGIGAAFGKLTDLGLTKLSNTQLVKSIEDKLAKQVGLISKNPELVKSIENRSQIITDLNDDITSYLNPKLLKAKADRTELFGKLLNAKTDAEAAALKESYTLMDAQVAALEKQIANKQASIAREEKALDYVKQQLQESTEKLSQDFVRNLRDRSMDLATGLPVYDGKSISDYFNQLVYSTDEFVGKVYDAVVISPIKTVVNTVLEYAEREYQSKSVQDDHASVGDRVVLTGGVEENVYIDNSTGEIIQIGDGEIPANILNAVFNDDPAEPKDAQTLANEAFDKEIDKIVKDIVDGDESLAQKIKDYVKSKIDEMIKKGEEWIEGGGIRKTILEQVDKMLDGKVSPEDAQRIHNLVDTLCNVNKDGGKSFCNTLGTDGKDLAVSLAIEALKKQLSDALPADAADMLNAMLDVLKQKGTVDDLKKAALEQIQELISRNVPYENTAKTLNNILQNIADGNAIDMIDSIKDVGKNLGVDLLKDVISKNLDPELAKRINALLDGFAKNGIQGVTDEALKQIYDLIDQYAPGADSAQKLKDLIKGTLDGTVTAPDFKGAATSIVTDLAKKLINDSNLPPEVKKLANEAIEGLVQNGIIGLTSNVGDFIQDYVTDQLGEDAGNAVREIFDAIVTPGQDPWETIVKDAPTIGKAIGQKVLAWVEKKVAAQIDKLIAKFPVLKSILDKLGITGQGIVQGIKNVLSVLWNATSLKDALTKLSGMAVNFLKNIAAKLINMALEYAINWLASNLIPKVVNWATSTLQKWADSAKNPLVKKGLEWLAKQVSNCAKCANVKVKVSGVGEKVIQWMENQINKPKKGKTVLETK